MKLLPALLFLPALLSAGKFTASAEAVRDSPSAEWYSSSARPSWAPRDATLYTLATRNSGRGVVSGLSGEDSPLSGAPSVLGGYGDLAFGVGDAGESAPDAFTLVSPGSMLAEWNAIPVVEIVDRGNPQADDYRRDFAPGSLVFGGVDPDAFQFVPPDLILAAGASAGAPVLTELGLSRIGVGSQLFSGASLTDRGAVAARSALAAILIPSDASTEDRSAPTLLSAAPPPTPGRAALEGPAPRTIASAALVAMLASASGSDSPRASAAPRLTAGGIVSAAATDEVPEPASAAALALGLAVFGWKLRGRRKGAKA